MTRCSTSSCSTRPFRHPLYEHHRKNGTLLDEDERPAADNHGQYRFNYAHEHIRDGRETGFLREAFLRDFRVNGPSLARMIRTMISGWRRYRHHPDACIRRRFRRETRGLATAYAAALWAMARWYRSDSRMHAKLAGILKEIYAEFGFKARIAAAAMGIYAYLAIGREHRRLEAGGPEPPTFHERNLKALALEKRAAERKSRFPRGGARSLGCGARAGPLKHTMSFFPFSALMPDGRMPKISTTRRGPASRIEPSIRGSCP